MAEDKLVLSQDPTLAHVQESDNTRTGAESMVEFDGSEAQCRAYKLWLINVGAADVEVASKGNGWWTCRGLFPCGFDGLVTDFPTPPSIHELQTIVGQNSIYRSSILRTMLTGTQIGYVARIVGEYQAGQYSSTTGDANAQLAAALSAIDALIAAGPARTDARDLFTQIVQLGLEDFIDYRSCYRRTITAATPQQVKASWEGAGKIWTSAEVVAFEGLPTNGFFDIPSASWLKSRPDVIAATRGKTQVVYTYTECLVASRFAYQAYGSATLL